MTNEEIFNEIEKLEVEMYPQSYTEHFNEKYQHIKRLLLLAKMDEVKRSDHLSLIQMLDGIMVGYMKSLVIDDNKKNKVNDIMKILKSNIFTRTL